MATIFPKKKVSQNIPKTIGICGVSANVGVTHLAFALANYLNNKRTMKTAYLEVNPSRNATSLFENPKWHLKPHFHKQYSGITIYPEVTLGTLPDIYQQPFAYFILDFGVPGPYTLAEFRRCDYQLIIGNVSLWESEYYAAFLEKLNMDYHLDLKNIILLGNLGIKENIKCFQRKYSYSLRPVPFLPNPFQLTSESFGFFDDLLAP